MNDDAIEMTTDGLAKARELAEASSRPTGWGEMRSSAVAKLAERTSTDPTQWVVFLTDATGYDWVTAVTGNGEASRANAEFYASARGVVLGLLEALEAKIAESKHLRSTVTQHRTQINALQDTIAELRASSREEPTSGGYPCHVKF